MKLLRDIVASERQKKKQNHQKALGKQWRSNWSLQFPVIHASFVCLELNYYTKFWLCSRTRAAVRKTRETPEESKDNSMEWIW